MTTSITIILNNAAGQAKTQPLRERIETVLTTLNAKANFLIIDKATPFATCESHIKLAKQTGGLIVAAGGDGTVNTVAQMCYKHGASLGIIPLGTFNYFARELSIPTELEKAIEVIVTGRLQNVSAGFMHEHIFLNNASFGIYPALIRKREQATSRFGRSRIIAALSAAISLFQYQRSLDIALVSDNEQHMRKTPMVFVGNNTLQLTNLGFDVASCTKAHKLAVVVMKKTTRLQTARLLLRGLIRTLQDDARIETFCADSFEVKTRRRYMDVVIDGEIIPAKTPLSFRIERQALQVLVPA